MNTLEQKLKQYVYKKAMIHDDNTTFTNGGSFIEGAELIIPLLMKAIEANEEHLDYAQECRLDWSEYDGRTHFRVASNISSELSNELLQMIGVSVSQGKNTTFQTSITIIVLTVVVKNGACIPSNNSKKKSSA
jgi:hypothetical protein